MRCSKPCPANASSAPVQCEDSEVPPEDTWLHGPSSSNVFSPLWESHPHPKLRDGWIWEGDSSRVPCSHNVTALSCIRLASRAVAIWPRNLQAFIAAQLITAGKAIGGACKAIHLCLSWHGGKRPGPPRSLPWAEHGAQGPRNTAQHSPPVPWGQLCPLTPMLLSPNSPCPHRSKG